MSLPADISMQDVYSHYLQRESIHHKLIELFKQQRIEEFAKLAVGVSDDRANYSASEYGGGHLILQRNSPQSIFNLAQDLYTCTKPRSIPEIIYQHAITYLKISVGSEISMMLKPSEFWVANVRTIWAHLLIKHGDNYKHANEELTLYRDQERGSEMDYQIWSDIHNSLETSQTRLHDLGIVEAEKQKVNVGKLKYLWADAIANEIYVKKSAYLKLDRQS